MNFETVFSDRVDSYDPQTSEQLFPAVYFELRQLAVQRLSRRTPGQSLHPTALVSEAYLRMAGPRGAAISWQSHEQFFAVASETMRRIVIDHYRFKRSIRRGGEFSRMEIDLATLSTEPPKADLLAIDEAIDALEAVDKEKALLVKLRYFAGMNMAEAAKVLEVSVPTAERYWRYARAWLADRLKTDWGEIVRVDKCKTLS